MIYESLWSSLSTPIHKTYFIISFMTGVFSFSLSLLMYKKYFQKKTSLKLKLGTTILIDSIAILLDPLFLIIRALTGMDKVALQGNISFGLMAIGNIFLLIFLREVFYKNEFNWRVYIIIGIEASILPTVLIQYYNEQDTFYVLIVHLIASFMIYISQYRQSLKLANRIKQEISGAVGSYKGVKYIGISGIMLFLTYVSFVIQELSGIGLEATFISMGIAQDGATIFIPIGFFLAGISTYFLYIGLIMPDWIKKRWEK